MRIAAILAIVAAIVMPACKSNKQPQDIQQMKKQAPDAKPTLHVAEDDPRYVASAGDTSRQVHYYSAEKDMTYVVDESTGKVVRTFKSKEMPGVVIIDRPAYQPPPLEKAEEGTEKEGCGGGTEIEEVEETTEIEEVEGCAEGCMGCAEGCAEGCDEGCAEGCGCE